jgi:hypothetical protein
MSISSSSCLSRLDQLSSLFLALGRIILVIAVLARIRHLIFKYFDELVEEDRNECPDNWSHP